MRILETPRSWLFMGMGEEGQPAQLLTLTHDAYAASGGDQELRAFVRADNGISHRLFQSVGYVAVEQTDVGTWYTWSGRD